jgi:hypothetical protein
MAKPTVYSIEGEEWILAYTEEEAAAYFKDQTGVCPIEADYCVTALTNDDLQHFMFRDDDGERRTFAEQLRIVLESGERIPTYFASANC